MHVIIVEGVQQVETCHRCAVQTKARSVRPAKMQLQQGPRTTLPSVMIGGKPQLTSRLAKRSRAAAAAAASAKGSATPLRAASAIISSVDAPQGARARLKETAVLNVARKKLHLRPLLQG